MRMLNGIEPEILKYPDHYIKITGYLVKIPSSVCAQAETKFSLIPTVQDISILTVAAACRTYVISRIDVL